MNANRYSGNQIAYASHSVPRGDFVCGADFDALAARLAEAEKLLREATDHLDYCGYGDSWERERAVDAKLPERLEAFLTADSATGEP